MEKSRKKKVEKTAIVVGLPLVFFRPTSAAPVGRLLLLRLLRRLRRRRPVGGIVGRLRRRRSVVGGGGGASAGPSGRGAAPSAAGAAAGPAAGRRRGVRAAAAPSTGRADLVARPQLLLRAPTGASAATASTRLRPVHDSSTKRLST